jgi:hypothetical protein
MADSVVQGLSADASRIPSKWNRNTVADGSWLQKYTLNPLSARDVYLASAIDSSTQDWKDAVAAEETRATAAEQALDQKIVQETNDRIADVNDEETRATTEETRLDSLIGDLRDDLTREIDNRVADVNEEETRAKAKEKELADNIAAEETRAETVEQTLKEQIDALEAGKDVIAVYGSYADYLADRDSLHVTDKDIVKVLIDEEHGNKQTYYQYDSGTSSWSTNPIASMEPYYSVNEINTMLATLTGDISNTYLSAKGAVHPGKNIVVTEDTNKPEITISTSADVEFTTVSSTNISATNVTALTANGNSAKFTNLSSTNLTSNNISSNKTTATTAYITNLSGASKSDTVDNLFGSAYSGAEASAWIYANSARLDIQAGYGLETGEDEGHLVIGLHQDNCEYNKYGLALGTYCRANSYNIGNASFAFGEYCDVIGGQGTFAVGSNVDITGRFSCGIGDYSDINGNYSYSIGEQNNLTADRQYAFGQGLSGNSFMIGRYNEVEPDAQFVIGGGTTGAYSVTSHKNLLVIKNDVISARDFSAGNVSLSSLTNISAFGNGITNTATFNLSAVKLSAGQGISFKNDTNGVLSISAEGRAYTGENYVKVDNTTKKISLSGDLVNSAQSGQSAYNWITTKSATLSAGPGIKFTSAATNTLGIGLDTDNFSASNISALNFYIPSANDGARSVSEISSNSTGVSAHIVEEMVNKVVTASWRSIIDASNAANKYVPLTAEKCTIGDDNNAYDNSLAQGSNNTAENQSLAQGCLNEAHSNSLAQGSNNSANSCSFAQGYYNSAESYSLAFGAHSQAHQGGFAFSPYLWSTQTKPSLASGNSFAFGNGCTAEINSFAMGSNCSAITGGFAYGIDCTAASNSIAMGVGMVSKTKQISLGYYGLIQSGATNNVVFHVGYGLGPEDENRRDVFRVTSAGAIASFNAGYANPQPAEVLLTNEFFQAPRQFGRRIPMRLSQGLGMGNGLNLNINTYPAAFTARHNIIFGDDAEGYSFNMWIPDTTASQEFTLTKAASVHRGVYRLSIGVDKNYSIIFKNFEPNTGSQSNHTVIKTGTNVTGSWPNGGTNATYDYSSFFLNKEQATSNTYFNFPAIPCDDVITFIVDGASKQFIMIKGHS